MFFVDPKLLIQINVRFHSIQLKILILKLYGHLSFRGIKKLKENLTIHIKWIKCPIACHLTANFFKNFNVKRGFKWINFNFIFLYSVLLFYLLLNCWFSYGFFSFFLTNICLCNTFPFLTKNQSFLRSYRSGFRRTVLNRLIIRILHSFIFIFVRLYSCFVFNNISRCWWTSCINSVIWPTSHRTITWRWNTISSSDNARFNFLCNF